MSDNVIPILSAQERLEIFKIIHDIKASSKELADRSRPMFNGTRYLSDTEVAKKAFRKQYHPCKLQDEGHIGLLLP